ncbi:hypothetical protein [Bradyrhizobium sp. LHD-71]|uniref:hypothetical protein n=1 Tax=Bradyrhizobium sp. LHD-71 TaxID=3072141 RepID=UPI0028104704|nr:hypothetical protein [Bradyrhizobium sp. LHD-71]MDQ8729710.1 hypothetical protein [Bradyrhizobium sp. LHD-71]
MTQSLSIVVRLLIRAERIRAAKTVREPAQRLDTVDVTCKQIAEMKRAVRVTWITDVNAIGCERGGKRRRVQQRLKVQPGYE